MSGPVKDADLRDANVASVAGEGADSTQATATPLDAPGPPSGVSASAGIGQSALVWQAVSGSTIDTAKWTVLDGAGTNITQNNVASIASSYNSGTSKWYQTSLTSANTFSSSNLHVSAALTPGSSESSGHLLMGYGDPNFTTTGTQALILDINTNENVVGEVYNDGIDTDMTYSCGSGTAGATYTMAVTSTGFTVFKNGAVQCQITSVFHPTNKTIFFQSSSTVTPAQVDNVNANNTADTGAGAPTALTGFPSSNTAILNTTFSLISYFLM